MTARFNVLTTYKKDFSMGEESPRIMTQEITFDFIELVVRLYNIYPDFLGGN